MTGLPPRERLVQVVDSLTRRLPEQLEALLASDRLADGRAALERLSAPGAAAAAAATVAPEEADRLAGLLLDRWAAVAAAELDPAVAIVGPDELWVSEEPGPVTYELATAGIDPDWTAEWTGGATPEDGGRRALLDVKVPDGDAEAVLRLQARVFARAAGRRRVLVAERAVGIASARNAAGEPDGPARPVEEPVVERGRAW
jgi:hypothetical protein